jgi:hypothetical protein
LSAGLAAYLLAGPVAAQPGRARAVLVLEVANGGWKEGVQAVVAELLTTGHELSVRAVDAPSPEQLQLALKSAVAELGVVAGVSVTRQGNDATAVLCRRDASACETVVVDVADGELSRSRLALAVVERLRPLDLPATQPTSPKPLRPLPPAAPPPYVEKTVRADARRFRAWLGGGVVLASGISAPMSWLGASLGATLSKPWGLEVSVAGSPLEGRAESAAGALSLRAVQALGFATFEPFAWRGFGFSLGLGGGTLHLRENAAPASGFNGFSQSATVAVVSTQARVHHRAGPVYWGVVVDPGLLIPSLRVEAGAATVLRIGRPWVTLQANLGMEL